ncbi:hypothetical protein P7K49_000850, partial [Saguinus oedipus]
MATVIPAKDKKLLEVKLGELPSWILMRDFPPRGIAGAILRGYYQYYKKYINEKEGGLWGLPWCWQAMRSSATAFPTRSSSASGYASATEEEDTLCTPRPSWPEPLKEEHNLH